MILLSHPTGHAFFKAAARSFNYVGWLKELDSCICWDSESTLSKYLPTALSVQLSRRAISDVPLSLQHSHPWRELARLLSTKLSVPWFHRHEKGPLSVDAVYRSFDRYVANRLPTIEGLRAVYAYEDGALHTFQAAKQQGLLRIYDLPIGYWRASLKILEEERALKPDWACTLSGLNDSVDKLARKDQELELADLVVVPSEFVRTTLQEHKSIAAPIAVVPFGSPQPLAAPFQASPTGHLRVLYVGSIGQRKGISYALDAVQALGTQVTFTMIGRVSDPTCLPLMSALQRHRWIETLPHHQVLEQMRQHDVLLLPSLFEGYALVISEALSQGLPVITTPNSGAMHSIRNGVEGFIVPIRDSQAIAERLQKLVSNRDLLAEMQHACLRRAAVLSWAGYEKELRVVVGKVLSQAHSSL